MSSSFNKIQIISRIVIRCVKAADICITVVALALLGLGWGAFVVHATNAGKFGCYI